MERRQGRRSPGPVTTPTPSRAPTYTGPVGQPPGLRTIDEVRSLQTLAGNTAVVGAVEHEHAERTEKTDPSKQEKGVTTPAGTAGTLRLDLGGTLHSVGIDSFSFGGAVKRQEDGLATEKPRLDRVRITRKSDDLSPVLMHALSTNAVFRSFEVDVVEPAKDGTPARTFAYSFSSARVASVSERGGAGPGAESLAFAFNGMSMTGPPARDEGAEGSGRGGGSGGELQLNGVTRGDATIGLRSVSWKMSAPTDAASGQRTGRARAHHVVLTKDLDEHSPKLLEAMTANRELKSAMLRSPETSMELAGVHVDSVQQTAGADPTETVALSFGSFEVGSVDQRQEADPDAPAQLEVTGERQGTWCAPVLEWSWGVSTPIDQRTMEARGKRQMQQFEIVVPTGPASVQFLTALQANERLTSLLLSPKSGPGYALASAGVTSFDVSSSGQGQTTTLRLTYRSIAQQAGDTEHQDQWDEEGMGGTLGSAKTSAGAPGPGKAGRLRVDLGGKPRDLPIESFSLGTKLPREAETGLATAKAQTTTVALRRHADGMSPMLFQALSQNRDLKTVEVDLVEPASKGRGARTMSYTFSGARVVSLSEAGGAGGGTEDLALAFTSMTLAVPVAAFGEKQTSKAGGGAGQLQLVGLGGRSADFPVTTVSWGAGSPTDAVSGQATGKVRMRQLTVTRDMDEMSPLLRQALRKNDTIESGSLQLTGAATRMRDIRVDAIIQSSTGKPVEEVSLSFADYEFESARGGKAEDAPATAVLALERQGKLETPVRSWSWEASVPREAVTGTAHGKRKYEELTMTVPTGPASVQLLQALTVNELVKTAKLTPKAGMAYALGNARVVDVQVSAGEGTGETVVRLSYLKVGTSSGNHSFEDSSSDQY